MNVEDISGNVKSIIMPCDDKTRNEGLKREIKTQKEKKDRVRTRDKIWTICDNDYNSDLQLRIMKEADITNNVYNLMCCEIKRKISGYKSHDLKKNTYKGNNIRKRIEVLLLQ
jgi:hypothetical protein